MKTLQDKANSLHEQAVASYSYRDGYKTIPSEYTLRDYGRHRPTDAIPNSAKESMKQCRSVYRDVGVVRNTVDLMADFASQGIRISHPNPQIEKFFRKWFEAVNGVDVSQQYLTRLYLDGNVVIRRYDTTGVSGRERVRGIIVPGRYVFYDPTTLEAVGGEVAQFCGKLEYAYKVPMRIRNVLASNVSDEAQRKIIEKLDPEMIAEINKTGYVLLPNDKLHIAHYKKEPWAEWAYPMVHSILVDVRTLQKMKLADISALDGAISCVRVWKLGSLEYDMIPTQSGITRLRNILTENVGGGVIDLVWTPDLTFEETSSQAYKFLGSEKYQVCLNSIADGLGLPSVLTTASENSSTTNGYISLKVLQERLHYGRSLLDKFWKQQIERVTEALGFSEPAVIVYDTQVLTDSSNELPLYIQLADRNLISHTTLLEKFKTNENIEKARLKLEGRERITPVQNEGGRPNGANDTVTRKEREFSPQES